VRSEVVTALRIMMMIWVLAPCRLIGRYTYRRVYTAPKPRITTIKTEYVYKYVSEVQMIP
jgi:hypothetical protein